MNTQLRVLLVFPSYNVPGLDDPITHETLVNCSVLPSDLKGYRKTGADLDKKAFLDKVIGTDCSIHVLEGITKGTDVRDEVKWLLSKGADVTVLLFCGHGVNEGSCHHGTLVCSYKSLVSAEAINNIVAEQKFKGTFIRILNMCETPLHHGISHGDAHKFEGIYHKDPTTYNSIIVSATGPFEETRGGKCGSKFMTAFIEMFEKEAMVTYESLEKLLSKYWPKSWVHISPPGLRGCFGFSATKQASNERDVVCTDTLSDDTDTDDEAFANRLKT